MDDIQICENIQDLKSTQTNTVSKDVCKSRILVLSDGGSVEACRQLLEEGPLEKCIRHYAVVSTDTALCDEISSDATRGYCYGDVARASLEVGICSEIAIDSIREDCLAGMAIEMLDPELCAALSDEHPNTKADCYSTLAELMKRPDLCEYVSPPFSELYKAKCIERAQ